MIQFYHFLSQTNLSKYNNVTVFLAPGVVCMRRCPCSIYTELVKRQFEDCFKNRKDSTVSFQNEYKETRILLNCTMILVWSLGFVGEEISLGYHGEFSSHFFNNMVCETDGDEHSPTSQWKTLMQQNHLFDLSIIALVNTMCFVVYRWRCWVGNWRRSYQMRLVWLPVASHFPTGLLQPQWVTD